MEIIKADTIEQYNRFFGFQTKHPLVGIVHFDRSENQPTHKMTFGFYALFLKKTVGCTINYGKTKYDFDDETVVCFAPGQTVGIHRIEDALCRKLMRCYSIRTSCIAPHWPRR